MSHLTSWWPAYSDKGNGEGTGGQGKEKREEFKGGIRDEGIEDEGEEGRNKG